jgi:signal transduction histidine kinase
VRKDGSLFWANVVITALYDETGQLHGFGKVTRDLTERRRSEEERIKLAEARADIRLRDEFLSIASHELKTPLGALRLSLAGFELLMQRRPDDRAGMAQRLKLAITQVQRLNVLIERLLDVSRIAAGRLALTFEEVDVAGLIRDVCRTFDDSARDAECELRFRDVGEETIVGFWDRVRIEQVLGNLLANSFKYAAGKPIDIELTAQAQAVTLSVADRGTGVEVADRERIFERFGTATVAPHAVGLGLGLYIARQIVNAHGGTIHVEDGPEGGATFVVRLPLVAATPAGEIAVRGEDGSQAADAR